MRGISQSKAMAHPDKPSTKAEQSLLTAKKKKAQKPENRSGSFTKSNAPRAFTEVRVTTDACRVLCGALPRLS